MWQEACPWSPAAAVRAAETCAPAKAGAQTRVSAQRLRRTGPLPSQGNWAYLDRSRPSPNCSRHPARWRLGRLPAAAAGRGKALALGPGADGDPGGRAGASGGPGLSPNSSMSTARDARDALWAMEEGLRCPALSAVIGEIWGDPAVLDFTATRRLAVAAERRRVPCWLVRPAAARPTSAGRGCAGGSPAAPSLPHAFDPKAPGAPAWDAELFRARGFAPGRWSVAHEAGGFHLLAAAGDRALERGRPARRLTRRSRWSSRRRTGS